MELAEPRPGAVGRFLVGAGRRLLALPLAVALLPPLLWAWMIWVLSSRQRPVAVEKGAYSEFLANLAHAPLFGLLTLFVAGVLLRSPQDGPWPRPRPARVGAILFLVTSYAVLDEWHQSLVPGRTASAWDVLTDVVGCALVLWIVAYLGRRTLSEAGLLVRLALGLLLCGLCAFLGLRS